jgi:hypothetical protein
MAVKCFNYLFEEKVLPRCKERQAIYANATTDDGVQFFKKLASDRL